MMVKGSCLCGQVRFEISSSIQELHYCHCSMCRKAHGSAFSAFAMSPRAAFQYAAGESLVTSFRSSPSISRSFCSTCGSNLTFDFEGLPESIFVSMGAIDGDPGLRGSGHIFVASKAPWFEITDALPQFPEYPPMPSSA